MHPAFASPVLIAMLLLLAVMHCAAALDLAQLKPGTAGLPKIINLRLPPGIAQTPNNLLFLGPTPPDPCNIGPTVWCGVPNGINLCGLVCVLSWP